MHLLLRCGLCVGWMAIGAACAPSTSAEGEFSGVVTKADGSPVAGAVVSVDGREVSARTDANGFFTLSIAELELPAAEAASLAGPRRASRACEVAVLADGFEPALLEYTFAEGEVARFELIEREYDPSLIVASPTSGSMFTVSDSCETPMVTVEGFASLEPRDHLLLDAVILVDTSRSSRTRAFDIDGDGRAESVLDAEVSAVSCLLGILDYGRIRASIVSFDDQAVVREPLTGDRDRLETAILELATSRRTADFGAAFLAAQEEFLRREELDRLANPDAPTPRRVVFMVTAGSSKQREKRSRESRFAAIESAASLGETTGAEIFAYRVTSEKSASRPSTSLSHAIAAAGGGNLVVVTSAEQLREALCYEPLETSITVEARNVTYGDGALTADILLDGEFRVDVPVVPGEFGSPLAQQIEVTLSALVGDVALERSTDIEVLVELPFVPSGDPAPKLGGGTRDAKTVADRGVLVSPSGLLVQGRALLDLILGEFEDAVELRGDGLVTVTPAEPDAGRVTIEIDAVLAQSCVVADFGVVEIDPAAPPASARDALELPTARSLFSTGTLSPRCGAVDSIAFGTAGASTTVAPDATLLFFILPERTLEDYLVDPAGGSAPLFSLASLNPGGFDQGMTFVSDAGRTEPGASAELVSPGAQLVLAFEDVAIASALANHDYADLVVTVRAPATESTPPTTCP